MLTAAKCEVLFSRNKRKTEHQTFISMNYYVYFI